MLQRITVCSYFYAFEIKDEILGILQKRQEKARQGLDYRIVKIMCFPEGGLLQKKGSAKGYFKGVKAQMHKNNEAKQIVL